MLLTRGREEEKLKCKCNVTVNIQVTVLNCCKITFAFLILVLFGLYSNESGSYVVREELQCMLQACENGYVPDSIASLFSEVSKKKLFVHVRD